MKRIETGIVDEPIPVEQLLDGLPSSRDGACLLFLGVVRDHSEGRAVSGLEYETYREMAGQTLSAICQEASKRFQAERIRALHRVGTLEVGEVATAIGVATPHRAQAYEASRYILEELKRRLPVWKREVYVDGAAEWVVPEDEGEKEAGQG